MLIALVRYGGISILFDSVIDHSSHALHGRFATRDAMSMPALTRYLEAQCGRVANFVVFLAAQCHTPVLYTRSDFKHVQAWK